MKRILILDGHPAGGSLSAALCAAYQAGAAEAGHETRSLALSSMRFDPDFGQAGYAGAKPLEPDLEAFLDGLGWAEHILLVHPLWWGGPPAKLKGMLDRALLPGRTFDPRQEHWTGLPKPLMTGRSAHLIVTSDTPNWAWRLVYAQAHRRMMARQVFSFMGVRPMRWTNLAPARDASEARIRGWIEQARADGRKAR